MMAALMIVFQKFSTFVDYFVFMIEDMIAHKTLDIRRLS